MERSSAGDAATVAGPPHGNGRSSTPAAAPLAAAAPSRFVDPEPPADAVESRAWLAGELRWARLSETLVVIFGGMLLLLALTQPAFRGFFFGEDFVYLSRYREVGNDVIRGTFNPIHGWFFRPLSNLLEWISFHVLPLDPFVYHIRAFAVIVLNVFLLHLVLKHLVASRTVRLMAIVFYAVSKIHLSVIGYLSVFDSAVNVALLLSTLLCFLRYIDRRRRLDYLLGMLLCCTAIFIKDYGLVIVAVVGTLVAARGIQPGTWRRDIRFWTPRLAPIGVVLVVYGAIRYANTATLPAGDPAWIYYAPQFSFEQIIYRLLVLTSTMANLSYAPRHITGASGVGGWLEAAYPSLALRADRVDVVLYVGFMLLVGLTLWAGRRHGRMLLVPLVCIAVYYGPSTLTRNLQIYYMNESLAASAILLGLCLDRANARLMAAWGFAIVLIGANAGLSNYVRAYTWQLAGEESEKVMAKLIPAHRGQPIQSLTFVTDKLAFWQWVLTFDGTGTMMSELLGQPGIIVRIVSYGDARAMLHQANPTNPFYDMDNGIVPIDRAHPPAEPVLVELLPPRATAGAGVNVQADGRSAISLRTRYATESTVVVMDGTPVTTSVRDSNVVTASVPAELLAVEGRREVYLRNGVGESNRLAFEVDSSAPAATVSAPDARAALLTPPTMQAVVPDTTRAGAGINVQPDGRSAIAIVARDARPESVVVMDGRALETAYNDPTLLTAVVPDDLIATAGRREVYLRTGSVESNRIELVVEP